MNKIKIAALALFLFTSATLFTACSSRPPSLEERIGTGAQTYTGIIEPLETLDIYQQGTHQLKTDDSILLIQSTALNLNRYINEEVIVSGTQAERIGNAKPVLNVTEIKYADENRNEEMITYEDTAAGFRFDYPASWALSEEGGLNLVAGEGEEAVTMMELEVYDDVEDLDLLATENEGGDAVAVTIGAQRALRFSDDIFFRIYVPNPPQKKAYRISFPPFPAAEEKQREVFYRILESFELIYSSTTKGEKCGGLQKVACGEGYRCELSSAGKYAEGVCVSLEAQNGSLNCPFIAPPSSCKEYRISEYNKSGCPARFECVTGSALRVDTAPLPPREDMVMSDGFEDDDLEVGDGEDMVMTDGEEDEAIEIPSTDRVTRNYENIRQEFSMKYPSSWYYANFGVANGSFLTVGFASTALEELDEAIITLSIMDTVPTHAAEGRFQLSTRRDLNSFFVLEAPPEFKEVLEVMLESIVDERS